MNRHSLLSTLLAVALLGLTVQCNGGPTQPGTRTTPKRKAAPADSRGATPPSAAAPRGPAIDSKLLVTVQVGALDRIDGRLAALAPPIVPQAMVQNLFTKQMLPELAKDLGLNPLALDALDLTRPAVLGLLIGKHPKPRKVAQVQAVAALPIKTAAKLVNDALKVSWPESESAAWGGIRIVSGGKTVAWVRVHQRWAIVAPTAPLLDSTFKALPRLARGVTEGTLRVHVKYAEILDLVRPAILKGWSELKSMAKRVGPRIGLTEGLLMQLMPLAEKVGAYLDSLRRVELNLRVADQAWGFQVKVTPKTGGTFATWLKGLRSPKLFGLDLLPPGALMAGVDNQSEDMRLLTVKLLGGVMDFVWPKLVSELPGAVKNRGLMDRKRAASMAKFRRTLRDLNLKDYKQAYALYKTLFELKAFRAHLESSLPRLIKQGTGEVAAALYAPKGPGISLVTVDGVKNVAAHRKAMYALMFGNQRMLNRLISALWKVMPAKVKKRHNLRRPPLKVVFNPTALRVGRVAVSSMGVRLQWPKKPRGKTPRWYTEMNKVRSYVELLLGKGDLTYAWAYVGKRAVVTMGKDWKSTMRQVIKRTEAAGRKLPNLKTDPMFANSLQRLGTSHLSLSLLSGSRFMLAILDGLKAFGVPLPTGGPGAMLIQFIRQSAQSARTATVVAETRERGAWILKTLIPVAEVKTVVVGVGLGYFSMQKSSAGSRKQPARPPIVHPKAPAQP